MGVPNEEIKPRKEHSPKMETKFGDILQLMMLIMKDREEDRKLREQERKYREEERKYRE